MKDNTCCFTGHRRLPSNEIEDIMKNLNKEIDNLIDQGVRDFISGGAVGFDLVCASMIIVRKQIGIPVRLIFALPCFEHDKKWSEQEQRLLKGLLSEADEIVYVSGEYDVNCMKLRNQYMVDNSSYCICALNNRYSGTGQTVNLARENGLNVVNVIR